MDKSKAKALIEYAWDSEGMKFVASSKGDGKWSVRPAPGTDYDPQCVAAVKRNFASDWGIFS